MDQEIRKIIRSSIEVKENILEDQNIVEVIGRIAEACTNAFRNGNKVLFCGNGGSAADAQHLAAELSGRFYFDRDPLPSEALHVNTSYLTAVANDYGYEHIYSRMVKGLGKKGDVLVGLSTSGNSPNIVNALEEAKRLGMVTVGMTGKDGGIMNERCDYLVRVPGDKTPRIQEAHIMIGHIICELIEKDLFDR